MASRPTTSAKRSSAAVSEPAAKPPTKLHSLVVIADKAQITGTHLVELGESSILHPHSKIKAEHGTVVIGKYCTVSEAATVGLATADGEGDVVIGDGVNIESGCIVEAKRIGDGTVIETSSKIGRGAVIGKHCKITPLSDIMVGEVLDDYTVVYGHNQRRVDTTLKNNTEVREAKQKGQVMHVELLRKLIPDASAKWR